MSELSSTVSSSSSSLSWAAKEDDGEFEVARVLAKLGNAAAMESDDGGGEAVECDDNNNYNNSNNWGSKGKRSSKKVKTGSDSDPTNSPGLELGLGLSLTLNSNVPLPFDLNVDQAAVCEEECDHRLQSTGVKFEAVHESAEPGPVRCAPHGGGRSRQNLTEAEKEARRIRRILANRESARQTIRRRQAMYEELTQKAANLASENENLKKNKEMVQKEFQSLQITNQNLKEQMSQAMGENPGEAKPSLDVSDAWNLLPANWPFFKCNTASSTNPFPLTSQMNLSQVSHTSLLHEKHNAQNAPGWCILPCPWFLPILTNNIPMNGKDDHEALMDAQNVPSPSSIIPPLINRPWALPSKEKTGADETLHQGGGSSIGSSAKEGSKKDRVVKTSKKKVDTSVGAEARKRRTELMKLKSLHCHPFRCGYG